MNNHSAGGAEAAQVLPPAVVAAAVAAVVRYDHKAYNGDAAAEVVVVGEAAVKVAVAVGASDAGEAYAGDGAHMGLSHIAGDELAAEGVRPSLV